MVHRGRKGDLSGLSLYIQQLQKIFNDHQTPGYTNTNSIIPEYDWGILEDGGSSDWDDISDKPITRSYKWIVGEGGYPDAGATLFTNSNFTNVPAARILVYRNGLPQFDSNKGDGDSYFTKTTADNFIGFAPALTTEEKIMVTILPL